MDSEQTLQVAIFKVRRQKLTLPWPKTANGFSKNGKRITEIFKKDVSTLWPSTELQESAKKKFDEAIKCVNESFDELLKAVDEVTDESTRRQSIDPPRVLIPPVTPHTKKTKRVRARKVSAGVVKRSTRSSKISLSSSVLLPEIQEVILSDMNKESRNSEILTTIKKPIVKKKKNVKMKVIEDPEPRTPDLVQNSEPSDQEASQVDHDNSESEPKTPINGHNSSVPENDSVDLEPNVPQDDQSVPEPMLVSTESESELSQLEESPKQVPNEADQQNIVSSPELMETEKENETPGIKQLINIHETLIESHQKSIIVAPLSLRKVSEDQNCTDGNYASPDLKMNGIAAKMGGVRNSKRSMEEQVLSCMKKNPVVNIAKLKMAEPSLNTIQGSPQVPLTLTFDASDEEDIADSVDDTTTTENKQEQRKSLKRPALAIGNGIRRTPVGTVSSNFMCPPRRSLDFHLRLSESASDAETSINAANGDVITDDQDLEPLSQDTEQDSLEEEPQKDENKRQTLENTNTTMSQGSVSLCSSSANTVVLDSEDQSSMSQDSCASEVEQEQEKTPPVRRSTRTSKRPSVITGLAAKRLSTPVKLAEKRIAANKKAFEKSLLVKNSEEDTEDSSEESSDTKRPRITKPKPVVKPRKLAIPSKLPMSSASSKRVMPRTKRNLTEVESGGLQSPSQPKLKYMKCASPLCHEKSKKKPASVQKSRNTFLNRSTASSRARRTPGPQTPSHTRGFAFTAASPMKIPGPNICFLSPSRPMNLTADVQSFIKRNTPQKANYEEQLAVKKQQLEEKQRRERELKKKKEEEKQRKIEEKRRKRSMRLREAAEKREQRHREEKEKQQKQVEQWEKRIADADKVKVLRKKEETAKIKKIKKKQVEAEEQRKREEEERIRKIKEQEQEKEQRLQEQKLLKEQEAALRKQQEQEKILEKQRQEKLREEREAAEQLKKEEEEKIKREEEERARRRKAEVANKQRQQKFEREEAEKKRKIHEEIEKKNAEAARIEQESIEKEKEAQRRLKEEARRRQEEAARRKEKEEARKRKLEEAKAAAEEKTMKRKQEEIARAEELRKRREEMRKETERKREEERLQREQEKKKLDEEKRKLKEIAEKEKLRKIQESNDRLKRLEEEHKQERERLKAMNHHNTIDKSLCHTPGPNLNSTYTLAPNTSHLHGSPQSYDITPQQIKVFAPSTEDNYNIDDIDSGDSTDDDENPRKTVPKWAKGSMLRSQLIKQYYTPPDMQILFRNALEEMRLERVFRGTKARYFKRTSSAHWTSPIMPPGHISFTEQCRGFDISE